MSRPPKPVIERNMLMGTSSVALEPRFCSRFDGGRVDLQASRLVATSTVGQRRRLEQVRESSSARREADDVQVVAVDPLDEAAAETLDRVAAGAALPLAARDVALELARRRARGT